MEHRAVRNAHTNVPGNASRKERPPKQTVLLLEAMQVLKNAVTIFHVPTSVCTPSDWVLFFFFSLLKLFPIIDNVTVIISTQFIRTYEFCTLSNTRIPHDYNLRLLPLHANVL